MAYVPRQGLRECTKEQFTQGTSIDGNRIELASQQIVDRWNALEKRNLRGHLIPSTFVLGFQGPVPKAADAGVFTNVDHHLPWMRVYNSTADTSGTSVAVKNAWRLKASRAQKIIADDWGIGSGQQFAWTTSFGSSHPVILEEVCLWMAVDASGEFENSFQWGAANMFPPNAANAMVKDFGLVVQQANPFATEEASKDSILCSIWERGADCYYLSSDGGITGVAPGTGSWPVNPEGAADSGIVVHLQNLNIPLPAVNWRIGVILPSYDEVGAGSVDSPWGDHTLGDDDWRFMSNQRMTLSGVILEEIIPWLR